MTPMFVEGGPALASTAGQSANILKHFGGAQFERDGGADRDFRPTRPSYAAFERAPISVRGLFA
ncbi:hypothetical protein CK220_10975 [Mesorhizobium sp. WSM3860]|nr:hypothetical protein CK220_10975 [Mesorhizobium sp. WSM3860]